MNPTAESRIQEVEERLRAAMLSSDVDALDELLAPGLFFTNHLGQLLGKEDDLASHRSGMLKVSELKASEQHVQIHGDVAIDSVRMQLSGTYNGEPANGDFRFTRVWAQSVEGAWRVVAAHAGLVG
jgi:ketosteroid isomerase-like protein